MVKSWHFAAHQSFFPPSHYFALNFTRWDYTELQMESGSLEIFTILPYFIFCSKIGLFWLQCFPDWCILIMKSNGLHMLRFAPGVWVTLGQIGSGLTSWNHTPPRGFNLTHNWHTWYQLKCNILLWSTIFYSTPRPILYLHFPISEYFEIV